ncbi:hypothetical protein ABIF62_000968 [Bradyrhizobium japonicum]
MRPLKLSASKSSSLSPSRLRQWPSVPVTQAGALVSPNAYVGVGRIGSSSSCSRILDPSLAKYAASEAMPEFGGQRAGADFLVGARPEMRQDRSSDGALHRVEYPGAVRIDIRPVKDRGLFGHHCRDRAQGLLAGKRGIPANIQRSTQSSGVGLGDVPVEACQVFDRQNIRRRLPEADMICLLRRDPEMSGVAPERSAPRRSILPAISSGGAKRSSPIARSASRGRAPGGNSRTPLRSRTTTPSTRSSILLCLTVRREKVL